MDRLYAYSDKSPYHLSVGAVLFSNEGKICVHKYKAKDFPEAVKHLAGGLVEVYTLMRETVQDGESIEMAVIRGVREEFGAVGMVKRYLGTLIANVDDQGFIFEKTTLYHSVQILSTVERDTSEIENRSELLWLDPHEALAIMEKQAAQTHREELNEAEIIRRFMTAYEIK